nr:MAG: hypothetical protein DIU78_02525 [Pseudomonadota bacterium]
MSVVVVSERGSARLGRICLGDNARNLRDFNRVTARSEIGSQHGDEGSPRYVDLQSPRGSELRDFVSERVHYGCSGEGQHQLAFGRGVDEVFAVARSDENSLSGDDECQPREWSREVREVLA